MLENAKGADRRRGEERGRGVGVGDVWTRNRTKLGSPPRFTAARGAEHGKSRLKTLARRFAKDKLVMEGNGGGAMDDAARDENEHAAGRFIEKRTHYGADAAAWI